MARKPRNKWKQRHFWRGLLWRLPVVSSTLALRRNLMRRWFQLKGQLGLDTSQFGEATLLRQLIRDDFPRYLVDVGAYDGVLFSNSFPFVRQGWHGLLIEPNPAPYGILARLHAGNPRVACVNKACSNQTGVLPLFIGTDGDGGMTSTLNTAAEGVSADRRTLRTIDVPVDTLTHLLIEHQAPRDIGLLLVDAEDVDHEVLLGLDFERFTPRVIVVEGGGGDTRRLLQDAGYALHARVGCNGVWTRLP